ncbi:MAG: hypothetical protein V4598_08010 [Bdellovibrionota bacterium]
MKANHFTFVILSSLTFMNTASADACQSPFFQRLSSLNGRRTLGNCELEVHVCERKSSQNFPDYMNEDPKENFRFWVGDIYVKARNGKGLYVSLFDPESRFPSTSLSVSESKDVMTYKYKDKNFDPVSGLKERYEIVFSKRRPEITFIMKNSVESRKRPIRSLFFPNLKINCK